MGVEKKCVCVGVVGYSRALADAADAAASDAAVTCHLVHSLLSLNTTEQLWSNCGLSQQSLYGGCTTQMPTNTEQRHLPHT